MKPLQWLRRYKIVLGLRVQRKGKILRLKYFMAKKKSGMQKAVKYLKR